MWWKKVGQLIWTSRLEVVFYNIFDKFCCIKYHNNSLSRSYFMEYFKIPGTRESLFLQFDSASAPILHACYTSLFVQLMVFKNNLHIELKIGMGILVSLQRKTDTKPFKTLNLFFFDAHTFA